MRARGVVQEEHLVFAKRFGHAPGRVHVAEIHFAARLQQFLHTQEVRRDSHIQITHRDSDSTNTFALIIHVHRLL